MSSRGSKKESKSKRGKKSSKDVLGNGDKRDPSTDLETEGDNNINPPPLPMRVTASGKYLSDKNQTKRMSIPALQPYEDQVVTGGSTSLRDSTISEYEACGAPIYSQPEDIDEDYVNAPNPTSDDTLDGQGLNTNDDSRHQKRVSLISHREVSDDIRPDGAASYTDELTTSMNVYAQAKPDQESRVQRPSKKTRKPRPPQPRLLQTNYAEKILPKICIEGSNPLPSIFSHPWAVSVCVTSGEIFMTDVDRCQIVRFGRYGHRQPIETFGSRGNKEMEFNQPSGIAVAHDGMVYVADTYNNRIQVISEWAIHVNTMGREGVGMGEFRKPFGVAVNGSVLYVADQGNDRIQVWTTEGQYIKTFGNKGAGAGELSNPHDVAINSRGNIIVADTNNNRIQVFSPEGDFISVIGRKGSGNAEFILPKSVAVDSQDNIIVADDLNNRVQILSSVGEFVHSFGTRGDDEGQFDQLVGVAVNGNNEIIVCDYYNRRLQIF